MNLPDNLVYGAITFAWAVSMALWVYLLKFKLPQTGRDIEEAVDNKAEGYITRFKTDFEDGVKDLKKELPTIIATEIPKLLDTEGPKLFKTFLKDITDRINDPEEEELADMMCALADNGLAVFRLRMRDPAFNQEVNEWVSGKMTGVAAQFEKRLPGILVKAAPEIKNAILSGGGGKEGEVDPMMQILGMFMPGGGKGGLPFG